MEKKNKRWTALDEVFQMFFLRHLRFGWGCFVPIGLLLGKVGSLINLHTSFNGDKLGFETLKYLVWRPIWVWSERMSLPSEKTILVAWSVGAEKNDFLDTWLQFELVVLDQILDGDTVDRLVDDWFLWIFCQFTWLFSVNMTRWWFLKILYFHPYLGKMPILTNIFQGGWNHQLDEIRSHFIHFKGTIFAGNLLQYYFLLPEVG